MLTFALHLTALLVAVAILLTLVRLVRGPTLADRILALDTLAVNAIALVLLWGLARGSDLWFEAALILAMTGFVGTVALARYRIGGDLIE
jgi:multicomponent K+:H+ antiporter subunit F